MKLIRFEDVLKKFMFVRNFFNNVADYYFSCIYFSENIALSHAFGILVLGINNFTGYVK